MSEQISIDGYKYNDASQAHSHDYLLPSLHLEVEKLNPKIKRIFDLGCGNGSAASTFFKKGFDVYGVDVSKEGIEQAKRNYPELKIEIGSAYEELAEIYGQFPIVYSLEVVEHVYAPRKYAETLYSLTEAGGCAIVSTPYHGYWKNIALAISGKMDAHFTALWDHGHIKFWSIKTLTELLQEAGFRNIRFLRVGRIPVLGKSMIAIAQKPD